MPVLPQSDIMSMAGIVVPQIFLLQQCQEDVV